MANLPDKSEMIGNSVTEAQFKQKLGVLLDNVASKDEVDTKKTEAIDAASEDATTKANAAETNAKNYADLERKDREALINNRAHSNRINITNSLGFTAATVEINDEFNKINIQGLELNRLDFTNQTSLVTQPRDSFEVLNLLNFTENENQTDNVDITDISEIVFSNDLCTFENETLNIYAPQLISDRKTALKRTDIICEIQSTDPNKAYSDSSKHKLSVNAKLIGSSAKLSLFNTTTLRHTQVDVVRCKVVTNGTSTPIKILTIGDSILDRGGSDLIKRNLIAHGFVPTMLGTVNGTNYNGSSAEGGELGEGRPGSTIAQHVYYHTSRTAVAAGDESAYLALTKTNKLNKNPFVRAAVGGDTDIYNGYTFDLRFYLDRFGFSNPDVVYINLGTNDIPTADYLTQINLLEIIIRKTRLALPSAGIVIGFPTVGVDGGEYDSRWQDKYMNAIKAIKTMIQAKSDAKIWFAPEFSMFSATTGFNYTSNSNSEPADALHPLLAGRIEKYNVASTYIAAAFQN